MTFRGLFRVIASAFSPDSPDVNESAKINIQRIAIDHNGLLGSIYDGYEDSIKGRLKMTMKSNLQKLNESTKCILTEAHKPEAQNLLKFVDINDELRLSILSKLTPATGIASFVNHPPIVNAHTRLLYVYYESRIQSYGDNLHELKGLLKYYPYEVHGTHIITEIIWGVHLLVVLQLPPDRNEEIDLLLQKMYPSLSNNDQRLTLDSNDRILLSQIMSTTVYSNMEVLTKIRTFESVYNKIIELQKNENHDRPLKYTLTPIQWLFGQYDPKVPALTICSQNETEILEDFLQQQSSVFKVLSLHVKHKLPELLQGKLKRQVENIQSELLTLELLYKDDIKRIHDLIWNIRAGRIRHYITQNELMLNASNGIKRLSNDIDTHINELESRIKFIKRIESDGFEYLNVEEFGIQENAKEDRVKDMLLGNDYHKLMFFSTDTLRNQDREGWTIIYTKMIDECKNNSKLHLVYADFTDSEYTLKKMKMERLPEALVDYGQSSTTLPPQTTVTRRAPPPPIATDKCINILLLGESGVGKSTFINAFANYLRFQSLEEAEQKKPTVIIPVSYVMTINDNFDERIIKFGETDQNENHNDFGQSVTQQCKSYVFNISNGQKLRIIDTPGFGDTRGDQQDDLNMDEIFSFLNNFSHLNGICLLFKPETAQLNGYFRSCCTQLFDYFGENIRDHLIFCFTNTRATFFAPGNTRPLLQTFFNTFPVKKVPFEKKNTFSFDSESFRYLVAIQNGINFDPSQKSEFEQSWKTSVIESKRFDEFLRNQNAYRRNDKWQSIRDAQFQINYMIRPMLEATRNILRNWILYNVNSSIKLQAIYTQPSSMICYTCSRQNLQKVGSFWILPDHLHRPPHMCHSNDQKSTEYRITYDFVNNRVEESTDDLQQQLKYVSEICAEFSYFLMKSSQTTLGDPFLMGIDRMTNEEQFISQTQAASHNNKLLLDYLIKAKIHHEENLNRIKSSTGEMTLSMIYDLIEKITNIPMIKNQVNAIKHYQQRFVEDNQHTVLPNETD